MAGTPTLILGTEEFGLNPGDCYGFRAGGEAHQIVNNTQEIVSYLEIGDRTPYDEVEYPKDDLKAIFLSDGEWQITHKNGDLYG